MADYEITFSRSARKELESLSPTIVERILKKIEDLAEESRPSGCRKITEEKHLWRIRVGDYRVIYSVYDDEDLVDIVAVRHRSKAYE